MAISVADKNQSIENEAFLKNIQRVLNISDSEYQWINLWVVNIVFQYSLIYDFMSENN